jgi:hypothetical protein
MEVLVIQVLFLPFQKVLLEEVFNLVLLEVEGVLVLEALKVHTHK